MNDKSNQILPRIVKTKPVLWVKFAGGMITPELVPLTTLARALKAISQLSSGEQITRQNRDSISNTGAFQLMAVRKGSARYAFSGSVDPKPIERLRVVGQVLSDPSDVDGIDFSFGALKELSAISAQLKCEITISDGDRSILARIGPNSARMIEETLFITGETSIFGQIKRVGGVKKMRCSVRIPSQDRLLYCQVHSSDLSRRLGDSLYEDVVLHGRATWIRSNWKIISFIIRAVDRLERQTLDEDIAAIRKAGGSNWDHITDIQAFFDEQRGE